MDNENPDLISESDFVAIWGARAEGPESLMSYDQVKGRDPHHVWSVVEGEDDGWYALPGFHVVNVMGFVVTDRAWTDEEATRLQAVWFEPMESEDEEDGQ